MYGLAVVQIKVSEGRNQKSKEKRPQLLILVTKQPQYANPKSIKMHKSLQLPSLRLLNSSFKVFCTSTMEDMNVENNWMCHLEPVLLKGQKLRMPAEPPLANKMPQYPVVESLSSCSFRMCHAALLSLLFFHAKIVPLK